jgi:hypothetical protein
MINPTRGLLSFPVRHATATMLFGAATNLAIIVAGIAIKHFALIATGAVNLSLFLLAAYFAHKYMVLQISITAVQPYSYGPVNSVTLDAYSVTHERIPTPAPAPTILSASMTAPALQQIAQGPSNPESPALNVGP